MKIIRSAIILLLITSLSGCGTLITYMSECFGPECRKHTDKIEYYQAVKTDTELWNLPEEEHQIKFLRWATKPFILIDFLISATVDTILLPFQAGINIFKSSQGEQQNVTSPENESAQ